MCMYTLYNGHFKWFFFLSVCLYVCECVHNVKWLRKLTIDNRLCQIKRIYFREGADFPWNTYTHRPEYTKRFEIRRAREMKLGALEMRLNTREK